MLKRLLLSINFLVLVAGLAYSQPTITSVLDPYTGGTKLAPGGHAVITGTNLGLNPLVTVGGVNAFNLVPPQLGPTMTIQIPWTAALGTTVPVIVTAGGVPSAAFNIALVQYAPVVIVSTSGAQTSPRHNSNGVGVTAATPAAAGENIQFYAIGLGPTNPTVNTGQLASNNATATTTTPTVTFGANAAVNASVSRLANGQGFFGANGSGGLAGSGQALIGVFLVNTIVPSGTAAGSYPVTISIGGATSNSVNVNVGPAPTGPVISAIVGESGKTQLCPGDIAILSGLNLGNTPTVNVGGKVAFNVNQPNNSNQMTIQIPVDAPLGAANVTLGLGTGQTSAAFPITLTQFAPALLPGGNGTPLLPFHINSQSPVTQASPAVPGETVFVLVYGLGPTNPVVPTGTIGPSNSNASTVTTPTVNFGTTPFTAAISALNNNQVGVYFVAFVVPSSAVSGGNAVSVSIGGATTALVTLQVFTGPVISDVQNAGSNITAGLPNGGIAQGAIFILKGTNLGPAAISIAKTAFQDTNLSGTSISATVAGTTVAPLLYYTSATQVAALMPSNTPIGTGTITVTNNGTVGLAAPITVVQSNLGIFTVTSDGQGVGIVTYPDYSLVSVTKAANCGGPYTTCGAANPGDILTVWATGLGPVSGSDAAGVGLGVDMTKVDAKLWLGGISATILFKGRGCCIGEDQIAFVVPDNVPTGCAVPLAFQIGNLISNYAMIAIAPKGSRTCTPTNPGFSSSAVQQLTTSTGTLTFASIDLGRRPNFTGPGQVSGSSDSAKVDGGAFTVPAAIQPFIISYLDVPPLGTCMVSNSLNSGDGGNYLNVSPKAPDAGPGFNVTGPNGSKTISTFGDRVNLSGAGKFLDPGAYTVSGTGGADIGSFNVSFTFPTPATLTSPVSGTNTTVTRGNGFTVTWSGGTSSSYVGISGSNGTDNTNTNGASFNCNVLGSAGTFTVPASVLLALPPGAFGGWDFTPGMVPVTFSAKGLSVGIISMSYDTVIFPTIQ